MGSRSGEIQDNLDDATDAVAEAVDAMRDLDDIVLDRTGRLPT